MPPNSLKFLWLATVALLGACAMPPTTGMPFDALSPKALLVTSGQPAGKGETTELRRVDLGKGEFRPEVILIVNAGLGGHQINGDTRSGIWLSLQPVEHGDYALVSTSTAAATDKGVTAPPRPRCLHERVPVFTLSAGKISIVRVEPYRSGDPGNDPNAAPIASDADVLKEFAAVRTRYPDISGEATIARPVAVISYADKQPDPFDGANRLCAEPPTFTRDR